MTHTWKYPAMKCYSKLEQGQNRWDLLLPVWCGQPRKEGYQLTSSWSFLITLPSQIVKVHAVPVYHRGNSTTRTKHIPISRHRSCMVRQEIFRADAGGGTWSTTNQQTSTLPTVQHILGWNGVITQGVQPRKENGIPMKGGQTLGILFVVVMIMMVRRC